MHRQQWKVYVAHRQRTFRQISLQKTWQNCTLTVLLKKIPRPFEDRPRGPRRPLCRRFARWRPRRSGPPRRSSRRSRRPSNGGPRAVRQERKQKEESRLPWAAFFFEINTCCTVLWLFLVELFVMLKSFFAVVVLAVTVLGVYPKNWWLDGWNRGFNQGKFLTLAGYPSDFMSWLCFQGCHCCVPSPSPPQTCIGMLPCPTHFGVVCFILCNIVVSAVSFEHRRMWGKIMDNGGSTTPRRTVRRNSCPLGHGSRNWC